MNQLHDITTILFDMDGVIADSEPVWDEIDSELLARYGHKYTQEYKKHIMGKSFVLSSGFYRDTFNLPVSLDELIVERRAIAANFYATHIAPFESAPRVLVALRERGLRIGLATSATSELAVPFLEKYDLKKYFDAITTGEEVSNGKPAPDIYLRAAGKLEAEPQNCLVVEDAVAGVQAGKSAQMRVAAIPDTHYVDINDYIGFADFVLNRLEELPALLES
jgi:HAD superfamily hydrolase (TIGR01509 family)